MLVDGAAPEATVRRLLQRGGFARPQVVAVRLAPAMLLDSSCLFALFVDCCKTKAWTLRPIAYRVVVAVARR